MVQMIKSSTETKTKRANEMAYKKRSEKCIKIRDYTQQFPSYNTISIWIGAARQRNGLRLQNKAKQERSEKDRHWKKRKKICEKANDKYESGIKVENL